jgi:hypothetical protein
MFHYTVPPLTDWPAYVVVPSDRSGEGLPIVVQVVGRVWREDVAIAAARRIEATGRSVARVTRSVIRVTRWASASVWSFHGSVSGHRIARCPPLATSTMLDGTGVGIRKGVVVLAQAPWRRCAPESVIGIDDFLSPKSDTGSNLCVRALIGRDALLPCRSAIARSSESRQDRHHEHLLVKPACSPTISSWLAG